MAEDFPNGGGGRAYLFTAEKHGRRISWFYGNSSSAVDLDMPIVVDGIDYGAPIDNLAAAMADARLDSVDLWIGTQGAAIAQLVFAGLPFPYSDPALQAYLDSQGIQLLTEHQYMDAFRLGANGIRPLRNHRIKRELGFSDVQEFLPTAIAGVEEGCEP